ncbi:MAG: 2-dehydropantoate 2-reductase N-terminal domain-containing protein, partial [Myxococcota bacterium]
MKPSVSVLGGGSWGSTLAHLIAREDRPVYLWVRRQEQADEIRQHRTNKRYLQDRQLSPFIYPTLSMEEAAQAPIIVVSVPAKSFREQTRTLGNFVKPDQILLSATKGIEPKTHLLMSQVLKQETACLKVGAISGPNLALEVIDNHPTATLVASRFDEVVEQGMQILNSKSFRAYGSHDILGVELAGALKNVMAIAAGIIHGIG